MKIGSKAHFGFLAVVLCISGSARADNKIVTVSDPTSSVGAGSKVAYIDLLAKLFPDVTHDRKTGVVAARRTVPVSHIDGNYKRRILRGYFRIESFQACRVNANGVSHVLVQLEINPDNNYHGSPWGNETALLAIFSIEPEIKLVDVIDVKTDQYTDFWQPMPILNLDQRNDLIVVHSNHGNSQQSYDDVTALLVDDGKLKKVLQAQVFSNEACGANLKETLTLRVLPDRKSKYPRVAARVQVIKRRDTADCQDRAKGFTRSYQDIFFWDSVKSRYVSPTNQLEALSKFNQKYF
jgi:hypothetical protein